MAYNANWDRWTLASIADYYKTSFTVEDWHVYILGVDLGEETDNLDRSKPARLAVSISSDKRQVCAPEYWLEVKVVLILTTTMSPADAYLHSRSVGVLESKIPTCFSLTKKGDITDEVFCTVNLVSDLEPKFYPSVGTTTRVSQTVYELTYKGQIDGTN